MHEHIIFSAQQKSLSEPNLFTITAKCKSTSIFNVTPYVSVEVNGVERLKTSVQQEFDTLNDCVTGSIKEIRLLEKEHKLIIYMESGKTQEINLLYSLL